MRKSAIPALLLCLGVITFSEVLDVTLHLEGVSWVREITVENVLTGLLAGALAFMYLEQRRTTSERRLEEIAYLNHHIRNALTAIKLARFAGDDSMRLQIIADASDRIEGTLRRFTQEEHVRLEDRPNTQP